MNIREVTNKKQWENFIAKQKYTSPFQSWYWGEFENAIGHDITRLGIFDGKALVGLIPLRKVRAHRGRYLYLRHGPILDFSNVKALNTILEYLKEVGRTEKYSFLRMSPLIKREEEGKFGFLKLLRDSPMHDIDAETTWVLNLKKSEEELLKGMRKNTRYYVRKAVKSGVEIVRTKELKFLDDFWKIYQDTVRRQRWTAYDKWYIEGEFKTFAKEDMAELYLASYKGKFIAASIILYYRNQAIYHHSGSLSAYANIPASYAIQWEAIKTAKKRGLKWYNFWGIAPLIKKNGKLMPQEGHPWEGLTFFKLGFGGEKREFVHAKDLPFSKKYYLTRIYERLERWRRGY